MNPLVRTTSQRPRPAGAAARALAAALFFASRAGSAETPPLSEEAARIVERERLRSSVESVLAELEAPRPETPGELASMFDRTGRALIELGPPVADFMIAELERPVPATFYTAAYVLGRVPTPLGTEALLHALEVAENEGSKFARSRKQWIVYALALQGHPDAVDLLDRAAPRVGAEEFMEGMRLIEVVAMLGLPSSRERLVAQLDQLAQEEGAERRIEMRLRALGRLADRSSAAKIASFLSHTHAMVRAEAARALGLLADPAVADHLVKALEDPEVTVRLQAATALFDLKPAHRLKPLLARLEVEPHPSVRVMLYRTVASMGGDAMIEALRSHFGREPYEDRLGLADALGDLGSVKGLNMLRASLRDADVGVVARAMLALERIGTPGAIDSLLATLADPRWPVVQTAVETLSRLGEKRAAPRIAEHLLGRVRDKPAADPARRDEVYKLGDALVALRYVEPLDPLREAVAVQTDPEVVRYLNDLVKRLSLLRDNGTSTARWTEATSSAEPLVRKLAYGRLADLGGSAAARALVSAFERVPMDEQVEILRALARLGLPEAAPLAERILAEDSFDDLQKAPVRAMAAWLARRVGGERMRAALRRSAARREGQDIYVLTYLAVVEGPEALPLLRSVRGPRLRWFTWMRGAEQDRLDWILRRLELGQSLAALDRPPDEIGLEAWRILPH